MRFHSKLRTYCKECSGLTKLEVTRRPQSRSLKYILSLLILCATGIAAIALNAKSFKE